MKNIDELPSTTGLWNQEVLLAGLTNVSIHDVDNASSASEFSFKHFLLLRILWNEIKVDTKFKGLSSSHSREWARQDLKRPSWTQYLDSIRPTERQISKPFPDIGSMTYVRYSQLQCIAKKKSEANPHASSPILTRARARLNERVGEPTSAYTSEPQLKDQPRSLNDLVDDLEDLRIEDADSLLTQTPPSASKSICLNTPASSPILYPKNIDEQVTNTALINFLSSLVLFNNIPVDWTPHRKLFRLHSHQDDPFKDKKYTYEARVDGYMYGEKDDKAKIIIETKPAIRDNSRKDVRIQESAQMAAWISSEPDDIKSEDQKFWYVLVALLFSFY